MTGNDIKDKKKKFEGSCTRVVILMMFTYCALYGYISFLGVDRPGYQHAIFFTIIYRQTFIPFHDYRVFRVECNSAHSRI